MDRGWLAEQLEAGRSMEDIAREVGRDPSTVAYWVNKHGLASRHAAKHRIRGQVGEAELRELVERGLSVRQIAARLGRSSTAIRHWLRKYGMRTQPARYVGAGQKPAAILRECRTHGYQMFQPAGTGQYRCRLCNGERVTARRRRVKEILIQEHGGACALCGYDRYAGALQFHHLDPGTKSFDIAGRGLTRAIDALRDEARKCILLCGNCHAEVEAGRARLPFLRRPGSDNPG